MRSLYLLTLSPVAMLAAASPAFAQDSTEDAPFSGFYIGAGGGYDVQPNDIGESVSVDSNRNGRFNDTLRTPAGDPFFTSFCNGQARGGDRNNGCVNDRDSWSYSGRIGFDRQMGPLVVGIVGEFGDSNIRDAVSAFSADGNSYTLNRTILYTGNARLRAGFAARNTLFYATGGGVYARIDNYFRSTDRFTGFRSNGDKDAWGYTLGGGIEQKINRHVSIGVEYLFNRLDDGDYRVRATGDATSPFNLVNADGADLERSYQKFRWHSMRANLAFRF